jgi:hypothetical protein
VECGNTGHLRITPEFICSLEVEPLPLVVESTGGADDNSEIKISTFV